MKKSKLKLSEPLGDLSPLSNEYLCHDITLSRGCLIAGLPPILAEGAGHHYKSIGWSLFYEIT